MIPIIVSLIVIALIIILIGFLFGCLIHGKTDLNLGYKLLSDLGVWIVFFAIIFVLFKFGTGISFIDDLIIAIIGIGLGFIIFISIVLFVFGIWLGDLFEKRR